MLSLLDGRVRGLKSLKFAMCVKRGGVGFVSLNFYFQPTPLCFDIFILRIQKVLLILW